MFEIFKMTLNQNEVNIQYKLDLIKLIKIF
jgi:hypothetical protein